MSKERPDEINGTPVEWRENAFGAMKCYVKVPFGGTRILTVPRHIVNPFTDRRHDLTKLSDDSYLKPMLALKAATNSSDHINLRESPVLTFGKDRWEMREQDGQYIVVKREPESKFGEKLLENE